MQIIESDLVVCVDVDDTLVSWQPDREGVDPPAGATRLLEIDFNGAKEAYHVFDDNVESLKAHVRKGHSIVVWSGSGWRWATAVVLALGLQEFVSLVVSKPKWLLDDMRPEDCMPRPYWGAGDPGKAKLK